MKLVKVSELKGNEKLAKHILTESGAELMAKGSIIKLDYIDRLVELGIEYVFVDDEDYEKYLQTITSTGNSFDVDIEVQILDENPGVKTTQAEMTKIGENYLKVFRENNLK